jgi:hypothetical protein
MRIPEGQRLIDGAVHWKENTAGARGNIFLARVVAPCTYGSLKVIAICITTLIVD